MKLLPDLWIAHPAADSMPVSWRRWLWWQYAKFLEYILDGLRRRYDHATDRALYPDRPALDDDIPF